VSDSTRVAAIFQVGAPGKRGSDPHSRRAVSPSENSVDISLIGKSLPIPRIQPRRHFFFIILQHSRRQMYLCPRAHCAFHLSSLQAEHLYTPYPLGFVPCPPPLLRSPFLSPSTPHGVPLRLYFASHSTSSSFVPFPPACLIWRTGMPPGTQRRELKYIVILILLTPL